MVCCFQGVSLIASGGPAAGAPYVTARKEVAGGWQLGTRRLREAVDHHLSTSPRASRAF